MASACQTRSVRQRVPKVLVTGTTGPSGPEIALPTMRTDENSSICRTQARLVLVTEGADMDRLNPLDAVFVDAEDADPHTSMAIASIAVFEGPAPAQEEVLAHLTGRLPLVPRYRQKLRTVPFRLGRPVWVDDQTSTCATTSGAPPCPRQAATASSPS